LARRHRVYFYDLLGYGQSDMPDADVSLGRQNALFGALLNEWKLARPRVLAHDYGGATALRAHFLDGIAYADLTLVNPVAIA
ncbi:alpha/beta hydrolase, partial [Burkholderia cenocepacia]|nr:alpha/beta hydrolase [Burkholderia cenocepacia]